MHGSPYEAAGIGAMVARDPAMCRKVEAMADNPVPHFHNSLGVDVIRVGAREFQCIGARPPFDHPHVFLDMGDENEIVCPYCSTLYRFDPALGSAEADPSECVWGVDEVA